MNSEKLNHGDICYFNDVKYTFIAMSPLKPSVAIVEAVDGFGCGDIEMDRVLLIALKTEEEYLHEKHSKNAAEIYNLLTQTGSLIVFGESGLGCSPTPFDDISESQKEYYFNASKAGLRVHNDEDE